MKEHWKNHTAEFAKQSGVKCCPDENEKNVQMIQEIENLQNSKRSVITIGGNPERRFNM